MKEFPSKTAAIHIAGRISWHGRPARGILWAGLVFTAASKAGRFEWVSVIMAIFIIVFGVITGLFQTSYFQLHELLYFAFTGLGVDVDQPRCLRASYLAIKQLAE
jgi:hypothetical protein